jgi:hypothetical protein
MRRKYLIVLVVSFLYVISSISSVAAALKGKEEPSKYVAKFEYTPSDKAVAGSTGVIFTLLGLTYTYHPNDCVDWPNSEQLAGLPAAMKQDMANLLMAKGFSIRGPFESYDLIPFQDKKTIDLMLFWTLELFIDCQTKITKSYSWGCPVIKTEIEKVEIIGKITLESREIVTRELMWSKVIPLTKFEIPYADNISMKNKVAKGIEKQYPEIMATISKLIDPEEMQIIKKQCQELKSKKGY